MNEKKEKTEEEKFLEARTKFRKASPRHVVTFDSDMSEDDKRHTFAYADSLRMLGNDASHEMNKRIEQLTRTKKYYSLRKEYGDIKERLDRIGDKVSDAYKRFENELSSVSKQMNEMQKEYNVTFEYLRKYVQKLNKDKRYTHLNAATVLTRIEDIWEGCEKVLYGDGKTLHNKKRGDLPCIRGKQIERAIVLKINESGKLEIKFNGIKFGITIPEKDIFLNEEYKRIVEYLKHPEMEESSVKYMMKTGEIVPIFRPCYVKLVCKKIRHKLHVFAQITIADVSSAKKRKDGSVRTILGKGRVACDNGSQSFAVVSKDAVLLDNLGEIDNKSSKRHFKREQELQRKIDRSIRAMNPDRFNPDGTWIRGKRGKPKKSKKCRRMEYILKELRRRDAETRCYANRRNANTLRALGDELIIEPSNAKALQKRAKKTEKSDKTIEVTKKDGSVKTVQKNKRKKRFGRSVLYRCSGGFQAELKKKFGSGYHEVNPYSFKASQYNHILDEYQKKKLSQRWAELSEDIKVQRDLYSAFLMYCSNKEHNAPDREICLKEFENFLNLHNLMIENIRVNGYKICNSGI